MGRLRAISLILAVLLGVVGCSSPSEEENGAVDTTDEQEAPLWRGTGGVEGAAAGSSEVNRPQPGEYVYSLFGLSGTPVPSGAELRERVSASGDAYTIDITNNKNDNTRRIEFRWEANRVLQLSNETVIGGQRRTCRYDPPLEVIRIPIQAESYESQSNAGSFCEEVVDIRVVGREEIEDGADRTWTVWLVEHQMVSGEDTRTEVHWFAPDLGRYVLVETRNRGPSGNDHTGQLLTRSP